MIITRYRTAQIIEPFFSLEVEVSDCGTRYYVNISVNNEGKEENRNDPKWWAYNRPMDQLTDRNYAKSLVVGVDFEEILDDMYEFWNSIPVFIDDRKWRRW